MTRARSIADIGDDVAAGGSLVTTESPSLGRRNLIINGAMQVAQRGTSSTNTSDGSYNTVDRWRLGRYALDNISVTQEQSSDSPDGFSNSWKLTMTTPESALATDEFFYVHQRIEGQNLQHLAYGTSSAKTMTCSFWVKSSVTGTYAVNFHQNEASAYTLGRTYTINSANTWEYKTVEIPGDTSGNLDNDNGPALFVMFFLSAGSDWKGTDNSTWGAYSSGKWAEGHDVDVITQSGATWQITGVQLEVGSVATPFEHRSYGEELALCMRYFESSNETGELSYMPMAGYRSSELYGTYLYKVKKRTTPTISFNSTNWNIYSAGASRTFTSANVDGQGISNCALRIVGSGWTVGHAVFAKNPDPNAIQIDAEL